MGEVAEMITDGILCRKCQTVIDGVSAGYQRICTSCSSKGDRNKQKPNEKNRTERGKK